MVAVVHQPFLQNLTLVEEEEMQPSKKQMDQDL